MLLLSGKEVASHLYEQVTQQTKAFIAMGNPAPTLAVVLVGDDPASATYVANKAKACEQVGFRHIDYHLPSDSSLEQVLDLVTRLNADSTVNGILVQLPLPDHIDSFRVTQAIDPIKDVDGLHQNNLGALLVERPFLVSCTPLGILHLLDYYNLPTSGKNAVIIGRSTIVGKPMAALLAQKGRDATVTMCHSKTKDLASITKTADILVAAIGKPRAIDASMVKKEAVVIDVGINRIADSSKKSGFRLVGDVDFEQVSPLCSAITPVPGGVGLLTVATLMGNTLLAAKQQRRS